jgi:GntR family phosphonate transport system transcriptional regulator
MTYGAKASAAIGLPRWRQISEALRSAIANGALEAGARMPTEAALAAQFAVNRHTARRALEDLARAGLIRTEQGRGSFVAEDVLDYEVGARTRFSEWLQRHNREGAGKALDLREAVADATVAGGLGLEPGEPVVLMERLGVADGKPVCLTSHWFSPRRHPGILAALAREATITAAFAQVGVADFRRQSTRVTARMPTAQEAALLATPKARPLLVCENVNVDEGGRVVEFGLARYPTPRVQIVFEP